MVNERAGKQRFSNKRWACNYDTSQYEENQHHEKKIPSEKSEEKIFKDLEVIELSEEDTQRDIETFYIHKKESSMELRNLKFKMKMSFKTTQM